MELTTFIAQTLEECKRRMYRTLQGLTAAEVAWRPAAEANSIGFMLWHVARVEDRWLHRFAQDTPEIWQRAGWFQRCNLPASDTGVGYTVAQIVQFAVPAVGDLQAYFDAVRQATLTYLEAVEAAELDVHPDRVPFPEVAGGRGLPPDFTIGRMFRQLLGEENQHLGQMAYVRGLQRGLDQ